MNKARRNHYVPKFLLSAFTDDKRVLYFGFNGSETLVVKCSTPNNLFVKNDLYRHDGELINVKTDVEGQLGNIESLFAPIHQELIQKLNKGITPDINSKKKSILIAFIVVQSRRTLDQRNRMQKTAIDIVARRMESVKQEIERVHGPLTPEDEKLIGSKTQEEYVRLLQLNRMASACAKTA